MLKIGIVADKTEKAEKAYQQFMSAYDLIDLNISDELVDIIIILGGDGFMLHSMHRFMSKNIPLYGINCGTIGFLLNDFEIENLEKRLEKAKQTIIHPLRMDVTTTEGKKETALAFNDVALLRETKQSAHIKVTIDDVVRIEALVADGILVATPAGSSAYNFAVRGPIIPICSDLLALTPMSPFRPRQWRGALLPGKTNLKFDIIDPIKRPTSAVADFHEVRDVKEIIVHIDKKYSLTLLFDHENPLEDKLITEQFLI